MHSLRIVCAFLLASLVLAPAVPAQDRPTTRPAPGGSSSGGSRPGRPSGGSRPSPGGTRPSPGNRPQPQPPRPNPGNRPGSGHRPGGGRPPNWGRPPQSRPPYHFRPSDRDLLRRHYLRHFSYINRARRPIFLAGGFFPYADIGYLTPVPFGLYGSMPPIPPGYQAGYFDGYVVVYDPLTYFIADVLDLLQ